MKTAIKTAMTRGAIARRTGCNIETVRYYEHIGLMPEPPRSDGGHRLYGTGHVKRLTFILRGRALGFGIEELRGLLALVDGGAVTCAEVKARTSRHLETVRRKLSDLERLEAVLENISERCEGDESPECPIIDALYDPASLPIRREERKTP
ncbi:MAG: helix-turn-helix domain-containing protein [Rhodospirillales bacterium]